MVDNGVTACVSDESVTGKKNADFEPIIPYHGVYSNLANVYFVPREALDIDYCDISPEMVADEYNTENVSTKFYVLLYLSPLI